MLTRGGASPSTVVLHGLLRNENQINDALRQTRRWRLLAHASPEHARTRSAEAPPHVCVQVYSIEQ